MTTSPDEAKAALLDATAARVREHVGEDEAPDVERFVRAYYAHVAPEDLLDRSELDLFGAALEHRSLARVRLPGEAKVHVYTPSVEQHGWASPHTVVQTVTDDMPFLVDSVSMEITRHGIPTHLVIRPILEVRRDEEGRLLEVENGEGAPESLIHVEIDRRTDPDRSSSSGQASNVHWSTLPRRSRTGRRCAGASTTPSASWSSRRRRASPRRPRRRAISSRGSTTTTSPSSATTSTRRTARAGRRSAPCPAPA